MGFTISKVATSQPFANLNTILNYPPTNTPFHFTLYKKMEAQTKWHLLHQLSLQQSQKNGSTNEMAPSPSTLYMTISLIFKKSKIIFEWIWTTLHPLFLKFLCGSPPTIDFLRQIILLKEGFVVMKSICFDTNYCVHKPGYHTYYDINSWEIRDPPTVSNTPGSITSSTQDEY